MARLTQKRQGPLHVHCCQFMGEPAGAAHMLLSSRLRFHCMRDACFSIDTFPTPPSIYPTRWDICSAGSQQLLTKAETYGNAAEVCCPVLMGAGLDRDSPIHYQLPTNFKALCRDQSRVLNQVLETAAAPYQCQGFLVQAGLSGCYTTHVQDTTPPKVMQPCELHCQHFTFCPGQKSKNKQNKNLYKVLHLKCLHPLPTPKSAGV